MDEDIFGIILLDNELIPCQIVYDNGMKLNILDQNENMKAYYQTNITEIKFGNRTKLNCIATGEIPTNNGLQYINPIRINVSPSGYRNVQEMIRQYIHVDDHDSYESDQDTDDNIIETDVSYNIHPSNQVEEVITFESKHLETVDESDTKKSKKRGWFSWLW